MKSKIVTAGLFLLLFATLTAFPQSGELEIKSNPSGASLIINGDNTGLSTPCSKSLYPGKYRIELRLDSYLTLADSIEVQAGEKLTKTYTLKESFGTIAIRAEPDADILINGSKVANKIYTGRLAAGNYKIEVVRNKFLTQFRDVKIQADEEYLLNFELVPEAVKQDKARKKGVAMVYSALFPGAGQSYLQRKGFPIIMGVSAYGAIGGSILLNKQAVSSYDSYVLEMNEASRAGYKDDWKNKSALSRNLVYGAAGLWAINMVWVLAMPEETVMPQNLSLQGYSGILPGQQGISLAIKF